MPVDSTHTIPLMHRSCRPRLLDGALLAFLDLVQLDLHGAHEVRGAMRRLQDRFAGRMAGVLVEPMITGGTETAIRHVIGWR